MTPVAFIIGTLITGICLVAAAFIISGAITNAAASTKESAPQPLQQPTLTFLTECDAADYLGISLNELDYMRSEGMLDNTFVAVTSLEQTGEEEYYAKEDGVEVLKVRPVMSHVTRFLFNRQLLDERMLELIRQGQHVNPTRPKNPGKPKSKGDSHKGSSKNGSKNGSSRPERSDRPERSEKPERPEKTERSDRPERTEKSERRERPDRDGEPTGKKSSDRRDSSDKSRKNNDGHSKPSSSRPEPADTTSSVFDDSDDDIFAKPAPKKSSAFDDDDDGFFGGSKASITLEDDDAFDLDVFGRGDSPASGPSSKFDRKKNN